jgi:type I restriction enzyme S subunit
MPKIADLIARGVLEVNDGYRTKQSELSSDGFRILRAGDVRDSSVQLEGTGDYVSTGFAAQIGRKIAQPGDVIVTTKGTVGRVAMVGDLPEQVVYSPQLCYFRVLDDDVIDRDFLRYWLKSPQFTHQMGTRMFSTDMAPYISLRDMKSVEIPSVELNEQWRRVAVLRSIDTLVSSNEAAAAKAWTLAEGLSAKALKKIHKKVPLSDLIQLAYGRSLPLQERVAGKFPVVGSGGVIDFHDSWHVEGPGIVVGRKGSIGSVYWMDQNFNPIDTSFFVRPLSSNIPLGIIYFLLRSLPLAGMNNDSAVPGLNRNSALSLMVPDVSHPDCMEVENEIRRLFQLKESLKEENRKLVDLRDTLLPGLIDATITVRDAQLLVSDVV